jgi:hypothetical protein
MNANHIFTHEEYAWYQNKPKGRTPSGAAKVKVLGTRKVKSAWAKNASSEVEVLILKKGSWYSSPEEGSKRWVPARDIIDYWDAYEDEQNALAAERAERARLAEIQRAERERLRHEAQVRTLVLQEILGRRLVEKGLPYGSFSMLGNETASVKLHVLLDWLGITEDEIHAGVVGVLAADGEVPDASNVHVLNPSGS